MSEQHNGPAYRPFDGYVYAQYGIDFEKMAADFRTWWEKKGDATPAAQVGLAALRHLRDETTDVAPRDAAKVAMTLAIMVGRLDLAYPDAWNLNMLFVLFGHIGQQLWDAGNPAPDEHSADAPDPDDPHLNWAQWTMDGRLYSIHRFAEPKTHAQVLEFARDGGRTSVHESDLEPLSQKRLGELEVLVQPHVMRNEHL